MDHLCSVDVHKSEHGSEDDYHEAERLCDERLGLGIRFSCFGLSNGRKKNDSECIKKKIRNTSSCDGSIIETGEVVVLEEGFHKVEVGSKDEFVEDEKQGKGPSVFEELFASKRKVSVFSLWKTWCHLENIVE